MEFKTAEDSVPHEHSNSSAEEWAATFQPPDVTDIRNPQASQPRKKSSTRKASRSKKRLASREDEKNIRSNRLSGLYSDKYRKLLNVEIKDASSPGLQTVASHMTQSQLGACVWTKIEKERLFASLPRLGKDNITAIATFVGTKSVLEVREYIQLLQQGLAKQHIEAHRPDLMATYEFPTAMQVSPELCEVLDASAEALAYREELREVEDEKQKWGEEWRLTGKGTAWVEEELLKEGGEEAVKEIIPGAALLNMPKWFELSEKIFMNPGEGYEDEHWTLIADPGDRIGIRATALDDLHKLVVRITKRIVSAAIFQSMSRLRSNGVASSKPQDFVKRRDVHVAIEALGLPLNAKEYWIGCARRCHLDVRRTLAHTNFLDYDTIEQAMKEPTERGFKTSAASAMIEDDRGHVTASSEKRTDSERGDRSLSVDAEHEDAEHEPTTTLPAHDDTNATQRNLGNEYVHAASSELTRDSDSGLEELDSRDERLLKRIDTRNRLQRAHDEYTELMDIKSSLVEEKQLWNILGKDPPFTIEPEEIELPDKPALMRKEAEDFLDWRDRIVNISSWELLDRPIPDAAFEENRRKRKRDPDDESTSDTSSRVYDSAHEQSEDNESGNDIDDDGGEEDDNSGNLLTDNDNGRMEDNYEDDISDDASD